MAPKLKRLFTSRGRPLALLVLLIGLLATLWGWQQVRDAVRREAHGEFIFRVADVVRSIDQRMRAYEQVLRGTAAFMYASRSVSREEWRTYTEHLGLQANFPGIQGIGFAIYRRANQIAALERQVRSEGFGDFRVWPEGEREFYTPIVYLEPFTWRNQRAFGYDMFSEPNRRAAMIRARDLGVPAATDKVQLVQETQQDVQAGFLLYLPVYSTAHVPATVEERRERIVGFVYAPFRMDDLMRGILGRAVPDLGLRIYDGRAANPGNLMYSRGFERGPYRFETLERIEINGQVWTLQFASRPSPAAEAAEQSGPLFVLLAGLALTLLLFALLWTIGGTEARAWAMARTMTEAYRRSEAKFVSLVQAAQDAIIITDINGRIIAWNRGATEMFGYREDSVLGRPWTMVLPERRRAEYERNWRAAVADQQILDRPIELRAVRQNGEEFPAEVAVTRWGAEGETFISAIIRDTSERHRVQRALRLSEERFRVALQAAEITVFSQDRDLRYTWVYNPMLGLTEAEIIGRTDDELFPNQTVLAAAKRRVLDSGSRVHEKELIEHNGRQRHYDVVLEPVRERGAVVGLIGAAIDITPLKEAEREFRASEARFRTIFESAAIGIVLSDLDGRILETNPAFERMLGYRSAELRRMDHHALVHPDDLILTDRLIEQLTQRRQAFFKQKERYLRKDGSIMWGSLTASLISDESGTPLLLVRMVEDITELRAAEEALNRTYYELEQRVEARTRELREQAAELSRSNAELEQFAYVASHDLQEPLRSVSGFAQLLERRYKQQLGEEGASFVKFIVSGTDRMRALITDLLTYSRVGARDKPFAPVNADAVVDRVLSSLNATIADRGADIVRHPLPEVWGDAGDLEQLFQNLIANALKFNESPQPRVEIRAETKDGYWQFSVADNGIGIEPAFFPRIFTIFQRGHRQEEYVGTGVGLAICKKVVERHQGRIWLESEVGRGTTFHFTLPKPPAEAL